MKKLGHYWLALQQKELIDNLHFLITRQKEIFSKEIKLEYYFEGKRHLKTKNKKK